MAEYTLKEPCEFVYRVEAVTKIVDGDTIDCVFDLGFDVMVKHRVRLLGIDTPELKQTCMQDDQEVKCGMTAKIMLVKKMA